jgi:hypothetical protein
VPVLARACEFEKKWPRSPRLRRRAICRVAPPRRSAALAALSLALAAPARAAEDAAPPAPAFRPGDVKGKIRRYIDVGRLTKGR